MTKKTIIIGFISFFSLALLLLGVLTAVTSKQQVAGDHLTQDQVEDNLDIQANGADGEYVVNLISGNFEGEIEGKVLTDTNCTPDNQGISRCHNQIELSNESKITIVNPHNMKNNRCLKPGETVNLSRQEDGKIAVELMEV